MTKPSKSLKTKHPKTYDIISIGDATLDNFLKLEDANVACDVNKAHCMLQLNYADKIAVEELHHVIGGNAVNNAVGSSRLGMSPAFYSIVGEDKTGEQIVETVRAEGVSNEYVVLAKGKASNYSVVLNYKSERTILIYHELRTYKLPKLKKAKWVYFTSMGKGWERVSKDLVAYIKKDGAKMAFNPGTHQLKSGLAALKPLLAVTEILFVNKEEAERIVGVHTDLKELLKACCELGPRITVITDGQNGSYVYDRKGFWKCGITPTPVIERTGAGDSFATAFVAAIHLKKDVPTALRWGTMNSASVILKIGPQAGLLNPSGMAKWLAKYSDIVAKPF